MTAVVLARATSAEERRLLEHYGFRLAPAFSRGEYVTFRRQPDP